MAWGMKKRVYRIGREGGRRSERGKERGRMNSFMQTRVSTNSLSRVGLEGYTRSHHILFVVGYTIHVSINSIAKCQ